MPDNKDKSSPKGHTNIYDRIFRENAGKIFMPLIQQQLKLDIKQAQPITEKLTKTIERETDFLYKLITNQNESLILHIEFQSHSDKEMVYRMAEYHGLILRKYKLPIRHVVVYLGKEKVNMSSKLKNTEAFSSFDLISLNELDPDLFLSSQIPELILLALLGNYKKEETELILQRILKNLKSKANSENDLRKYLIQLSFLARLRKVQKETLKILETMPITIDIETDELYLKGVEQGIEMANTKYEKYLEGSISKLRNRNLSIQDIADVLSISVEKVKNILKELEIK